MHADEYGPFGPLHLLRPDEPWQSAGRDDQKILLVAPDGIFVVEQNPLMTWARRVVLADLLTICARHGQTQIGQSKMLLNVRVPFCLFTQAVAFFRHIWLTRHREDILLLYYDFEQRSYSLVHPPLRFADAHRVEYDIPETPANAIRFGSFHAHGEGDAYHSQTDRRDDLPSPGLHCVFGHLDRPFTAVACYWVADQRVIPVQPWDVFEEPESSPFPQEWTTNVPVHDTRSGYQQRPWSPGDRQ